MNTRIIIVGVLLILGAISVHYITPIVISRVDVITSPLQGNMVCGLTDGSTIKSQVTATPFSVNLYFHENICSTLKTSETVLHLISLGAGFIGTGLGIFGGLATPKPKKGQLERKKISP